MTRTTATTQTITEDNPSVLSYRVGQLEKTVANGLKEVKDELHELQRHYATKLEVAEAKAQAHEEHIRIWDEIKKVDGKVDTVQTTVDTIRIKNVSMSIAKQAVFALIGLILIAVVTGLVNLIIPS